MNTPIITIVNAHTEPHISTATKILESRGRRTNKWIFLPSNTSPFIFYPLFQRVFSTSQKLGKGIPLLLRPILIHGFRIFWIMEPSSQKLIYHPNMSASIS
jgi:hypothetical protein